MSKLLPATQALRNNVYYRVLQRISEGQTQKNACEAEKVSVQAFIEWRRNNPEALAAFNDLLMETTRDQLAQILVNRTKIVSQMIKDAISPVTRPGERVTIFNALENHLEKLANETRINAQTDNAALEDVLGGPTLKPGVSRFAIEETPDKTKTTITIERETGQDSVDGDWHDAEPPNDLPALNATGHS